MLSKRVVDFINKANSFLKDYYELFYRFDANRLSSLPIKGRELIDEGMSILGAGKEHEIAVANILISQINKIMDFTASIIAINT